MRRVQLQFTDEQVQYLESRAAHSGRSIAAVVREFVEQQRGSDERGRRIDRALTAIREGDFRSGLHDVAENHDEYLVQAIEERIGRR